MRTRRPSTHLVPAAFAALLLVLLAGTPALAGVGNLDSRLQDDGIETSRDSGGASDHVAASVAPLFAPSTAGGGSGSLEEGISGLANLFQNLFKGLSEILNQFMSGVFTGGVQGGNPFGGSTPGGGATVRDGGSSGGTTGVATGGGSSNTARPPADDDKAAPPSTPAGGRGPKALYNWLRQSGLSGEKLKMAWAIAMGESGGNPRAYNGNSRTGDKSYGLFQINMIGSMGPARRRQFGISSNEQLFDPMTNIRAMMKVSGNGTNWRPWSVYKNGTYRRFLNQYPPR